MTGLPSRRPDGPSAGRPGARRDPRSPRRKSSAGRRYRLSLTLGFGAVVLFLALGIVLIADRLFDQLRTREEDRLSEALTLVVAESVSRVTFSGKYQARLLVEELAGGISVVSYISVETKDGLVLAHSNPALNDTPVSLEDFQRTRQSLASGGAVVAERVMAASHVKEIVIPYRGGLDAEVLGVVRLGVDVLGARQEQNEMRATLLVLGAGFALAGILCVGFLGRRFGGTVNDLADELEGILEFAPMPLWISDRRGSLRVSSAEAEGAFGREAVFGDLAREVLRSGESVEREIVARRDEGERAWLVSVFPIALDDDGRVELVCTFLRDFTERRRSEEEIRRLNVRLEARILERTEALELANRELTKTNLALEQTLTKLGDAQQVILRSEKLSALGQLSAGVAHDLNTPLGAIVSSSRSLVELLGGGLARFAPFLRALGREEQEAFDALIEFVLTRAATVAPPVDRAARRTLEAKLSKAGARDPGRAAELAAEAGLVDRFDEVIACAALPRGMDILEVAAEFAAARSLIAVVDTAAERAARVVAALKNYLRRDSEEVIAPIRLRDGIETVLVLYHNRIKYGVLLSADYRSEDPALGNTNLLSQVWINLVDNALQAMNYQGKLDIVVDREGDELVVSMTDDGPGIPPEIRGRIFEPFFTTKKKGEGLGLGLDICRSLVETMGGRIEVESAPGRTRFSVRLRAADARREA